MHERLDKILTKNPDRRLAAIVAGILIVLLLCCLCLICASLAQPRVQQVVAALQATAPVTLTSIILPSATATSSPSAAAPLIPARADALRFTSTPFVTDTRIPSFTPMPPITLTPTPTFTSTVTRTVTPSITITRTITPTITPTRTITNTPNPLNGPEYLAVYERTGHVWVTSANNNSLVELDGKSLQTLSKISIDSPNGIAIWQSRGLAYVTNKNKNTVTEVDLDNTDHPTKTYNVGNSPMGVSVEQSSGALFVANYGDQTVSCIPPDRREVLENNNGEIIVQPRKLAAFLYTHDIGSAQAPEIVTDSGAAVVDANGWFYIIYIRDNRCINDFYYFLQMNSAYPVDIAVMQKYNDQHILYFYFFITDSVFNSIWEKWYGSYKEQYPSVQKIYTFPNPPFAIGSFGNCLGMVVPEENQLYVFSVYPEYGWINQLNKYGIGPQTNNGGLGVAYDAQHNVAYVTNWGSNTVSQIALPNSCIDKTITPTPVTPSPTPITPSPTPTFTSTPTNTPIPPTPTFTFTPTNTPIPPTPTFTDTPTDTPVPPTPTVTPTPTETLTLPPIG